MLQGLSKGVPEGGCFTLPSQVGGREGNNLCRGASEKKKKFGLRKKAGVGRPTPSKASSMKEGGQLGANTLMTPSPREKGP